MPEFTTDLNGRERARYAASLRNIADNANKLAVSLETGDDAEAIVLFITMSLGLASLTELREILVKTSEEFAEQIKQKVGGR